MPEEQDKEYRSTIENRIKEIRELNNQENTLINYRLTWMGVIQGFLITSFVGATDKYLKTEQYHETYLFVMLVLILLGFFLSLSFYYSLNLAHIALLNLTDLYKQLLQKLNPSDDSSKFLELPIAIGLLSNIKSHKDIDKPVNKFLDPWRMIPMVFIVLWVVLLALTCYYGFGYIFSCK